MTPREKRDDTGAPPPPKDTIGKLPKNGERPSSLPRVKGGVHQFVAAYETWGKKEKKLRHGGVPITRDVLRRAGRLHLGRQMVTPPIIYRFASSR